MKKFDMAKHIGNIDENYIADALTYKPVSRSKIRFIALAACIAIIVTAVPFAFILNMEDNHTHDHENNENGETIIDENVLKSYEDIMLENGSLKLNMIQLSNGKILKGSTSPQKYVYEHEPFDVESAHLAMASSSLTYHGVNSFKFKDYSDDKIIIGNSLYRLNERAGKVTRIVSADYEKYNTHINEDKFVDGCIINDGFVPGTIKFPKDATEEDVFEIFSNQIDTLNRLLVENLDSCWIKPYKDEPDQSRHVLFWDSSNKRINDSIINTLKKNEGKDIDDWLKEYQNMLALGFRVDFSIDSNDYVNKINCYEWLVGPQYFHLDYENIMEDKIRYLSPKIDKYYVCGSADEDLLECASQLEQYLIDVFKITGLTDSYTIKGYLHNYQDPLKELNNFNILGTKTLRIKLTPTKDHENDEVVITFETMDGETYYLSEISTYYCLGGDRYVELTDIDTAISYLALGCCLGDVGIGCDICREETYKEIKAYIKNTMTYELVVLPEVVFELYDGTVIYDLPFYEFTSSPDENGNIYVAYVLAVDTSGDYNLDIDISKLNSHLSNINSKQCPNYLIHNQIMADKKKASIQK